MSTELIPVEMQTQVRSEIESLINGSSEITIIETAPQYENAVSLTRAVKVTYKKLDDQRDGLVRPINGQVKEINAWFKENLSALDAVEQNLKAVIGKYQAEQERLRLEAQRKADEVARKEREKIEAEARAQREREEAARRAEEEARRRAAQAASEAERTKALAEAERAARRAEDAAGKAAVKEATAETVVATYVPKAEKPAGVSTVTMYSAKEVNKAAFVEHCLKSGQLNLLSIDLGAVGRIFQATKGSMQFPGVECIKTEQIRMRT